MQNNQQLKLKLQHLNLQLQTNQQLNQQLEKNQQLKKPQQQKNDYFLQLKNLLKCCHPSFSCITKNVLISNNFNK